MAATIDSPTAEHTPLASVSTSASADSASRRRSPSPCAATWSLPFRHAASASPSATLLVLPDGSARLYTEELTVAQLACDFPDVVVSCSAIVAGDTRARAQLAAHGASGGGGTAAGSVGGSTALDRPVGACHVAVPAGRALRRCFSHTEMRVGDGRVVWWGGEAEQAERQGEAEAEDGAELKKNGKTRIDNIRELESDDLGSGGVVNGGDSPSLLSLTDTPASKSAEAPTTVTSATGTCDVHAPVTVSSRPGHNRRRTMDICLPLPSLSPATVPATVSARRGSFSAAQSPKSIPSGSAGSRGGAASAAFSPSPLRANSESPIPSASSVSSFNSSFNSSFSHSSSSSSPASSTSSPSSCFSSHSPSLPSPSHTPSPHLPQKQPTPSLLSPSQLLPPLAHPSPSCASPTSHLETARPISPHCTQSLLCSHSPHSTASNSSHLPPLPSPSGLPGLSALQGHVGRAPVSPHSLSKGTGKVVRVSRFQRQEGEG
ncbi:unnamed protein product [Closterium sp. Naga37s-1]|nr:unnamed protein product [Closterium sp. Naga37s-1]